jgi:hypothetical protein
VFIYHTVRANAPPGISDLNVNNNSAVATTHVLDVRILSPTGNQVWPVGSLQQISWATSEGYYPVELSFTDGTTTVPIATLYSWEAFNPGIYHWTVAAPLTTGRIRARFLNGSIEEARDESAGEITITAPAPPPAPRSDFNGDGKPDLLWRHQTAGHLVVWYMDGVTRVGGAALEPGQVDDVSWQVVLH